MPRDGSGNYTLPAGNPVSGVISDTVHNNTMSDLADEITDSVSRSGRNPTRSTALSMGGNQITDLREPTSQADLATYEYFWGAGFSVIGAIAHETGAFTLSGTWETNPGLGTPTIYRSPDKVVYGQVGVLCGVGTPGTEIGTIKSGTGTDWMVMAGGMGGGLWIFGELVRGVRYPAIYSIAANTGTLSIKWVDEGSGPLTAAGSFLAEGDYALIPQFTYVTSVMI